MNNYKLQFITHYNDRYSYIDSARIALEGGCRWIQLRMKDANAAELLAKPNVDGGLIGGASLVASKFTAIVDAAQ